MFLFLGLVEPAGRYGEGERDVSPRRNQASDGGESLPNSAR